jgi:hypothetical protein
MPGPTKPAYFANIRFDLANRSEKDREVDNGRDVLVTEVGVVSEPRGRPVWNTLDMLI